MVDVGCIFLNYRRQQAEWPTMRLRDRLVEVFGDERIFTDVDSSSLVKTSRRPWKAPWEVAVSFSPSSGKTG